MGSSLPKMPSFITKPVSASLTGGTSLFGGDVGKSAKSFGGLLADPLGYMNDQNQSSVDNSHFSISPEEVAANQKAITDLAQQQADQTNAFNTQDQAARAASRGQLANLLQQQAATNFQAELPNIAENTQAKHLYDSTGYGQEVARQQALLNSNIASQVGQVGLNDVNRSSDIGLGAIQQQQGLGQNALSRGFSLEDFIRQANVAKSIGAQTAPQVGGKGSQVGGGLSGAASGAQLGSSFGPWGALIGGAGGGLLGASSSSGGKGAKPTPSPYAGLGN